MNEKNNFLYSTLFPHYSDCQFIYYHFFFPVLCSVGNILIGSQITCSNQSVYSLKAVQSGLRSTWRKWRCQSDIKKDPTRKLLVAADGCDSRIWIPRENPLPGGGGSERELAVKTRKKSRSPEEFRKEKSFICCYIKTYRVSNDFIWNMMLNKLWSVNWSW